MLLQRRFLRSAAAHSSQIHPGLQSWGCRRDASSDMPSSCNCRNGWFAEVWTRAVSEYASFVTRAADGLPSRVGPGAEAAEMPQASPSLPALAQQLMKVRAPDGVIPRELAEGLWSVYANCAGSEADDSAFRGTDTPVERGEGDDAAATRQLLLAVSSPTDASGEGTLGEHDALLGAAGLTIPTSDLPPDVRQTLSAADQRRLGFFASLAGLSVDARLLQVDTAALSVALDDLLRAGDGTSNANNSAPLRSVLAKATAVRQRGTPLYERWFRRSLVLPDGAKRLIHMRRDLLAITAALERLKARSPSRSSLVPTSDTTTQTFTVAQLQAWLRTVLERVRPVEASIAAVLRGWASGAHLVTTELSWSTAPAAVVESVLRHEAVHAFAGLEDVKRRMRPSPMRHAFAFFHPSVATEPLAMVSVALTRGVADNVDRILTNGGRHTGPLDFYSVPNSKYLRPGESRALSVLPDGDPARSSAVAAPKRATAAAAAAAAEAPDTAIFYTITSTQDGLKGIELGNQLIKNAVLRLQQMHPYLRQFSTLSPIPGYGRWLDAQVKQVVAEDDMARASLSLFFGLPSPTAGSSDAAAIAATASNPYRVPEDCCAAVADALHLPSKAPRDVAKVLVDLIVHQRPEAAALLPPHAKDWWECAAVRDAIRPLVLASVWHYLVHVKRRGRAYDPVANFHLRNGAILFRINWMANVTERGSRNSGCVMANYYYDLGRIEENVARYGQTGTFDAFPNDNVSECV